jgi:SAM-dependent methyltransferase
MSDSNQVRQSVSEFYTRAVKSESGCGCSGGDVVPKGFAVQFAGYGDDVEGLPADAVANSFGCGNPLAFSEVKPGEAVLDLGSGAGIDLLIAARKVGPSGRVIGIDMTDEMIARARANTAEAGFVSIHIHSRCRMGDRPVAHTRSDEERPCPVFSRHPSISSPSGSPPIACTAPMGCGSFRPCPREETASVSV